MTCYLIRTKHLCAFWFIAILTLGAGSVFGEEWQLDYGSLGPIKIGMTPSQVEKATGQMLEDQEMGCSKHLPNNKGVNLFFDTSADGKEILTAILISSSKYRTSKGVGIGSSLSEIENAYGKTQPVGDTWKGKRVYTTVDHFVEDNYIINLAPPTNVLVNGLLRIMQFEIGKFSPKSRVKSISAGWILGTDLCG
jgi:hypothetical protein